MQLVKLGLANLNPTVGALESNLDGVLTMAREMADDGVHLGVFTEQVLSGYPTEDLVQWRGFVSAQWSGLEEFRAASARFSFPSVFAIGLSVEDRGLIYNAVAVVGAGKVFGIVPKEILPTYDVFYERRVFTRGVPYQRRLLRGVAFGDLIFEMPFATVAVEVCEDLWVPDGPMLRRSVSGAELVVNLSASPWRGGVVDTRRELIATRAGDNQVCLAYVNQVGGQDSLVFDGGGFVNQNGRMLLEAERWREGWTSSVVDLNRTRRLRAQNTTWRSHAEAYARAHPAVECVVVELPEVQPVVALEYPAPGRNDFFSPDGEASVSPEQAWFEDLLSAMKMGLAGYFEKTGAFERLGIALSGGKDSTLTLLVAWLYARDRFDSLPEEERLHAVRDFIHCFSMPTRFNSDITKSISRKICEELGVSFTELSIEDAFEREVEAVRAMLPASQDLTALTLQNIQARLRGQRMWNWSNTARAMWLQTGNMSERAVGYTTVGGDLMGAYSLIGNLPKTIVIRLLDYLRERHDFEALDELMATEASAELSEDQEDERDLMPFPVLDACFALFAGEKLMPVDLYRAVRTMWSDDQLRAMRSDYEPGMLKSWVKRFCRLFVGSIFKWVQMPQTVHLGNLDLDRERALQLPVVQSLEWLDIDAIDAESD